VVHPDTPRQRSAKRSGSSDRTNRTAGRRTPIRLQLHDNFELRSDDRELQLPLGTQRLVAFLALHPGMLTRSFVAGSLWLDVPEERAAANLRSALWRARPSRLSVVVATRTHVSLDAAVWVDHHHAVEAAHRVLESNEVEDDDLRLRVGELLPDWYDEWVTVERERFRLLRLHALEVACERLAARGRFGEAVEAGMTAVAAEPLRESAHRALVRVHLAAGNWWEAIHQYESYKGLLEQQLDLPPSDEMEALIRPIRKSARRPAVSLGRAGGR